MRNTASSRGHRMAPTIGIHTIPIAQNPTKVKTSNRFSLPRSGRLWEGAEAPSRFFRPSPCPRSREACGGRGAARL